MSDLIERLQMVVAIRPGGGENKMSVLKNPDGPEAATLIATLVEALAPFSEAAIHVPNDREDQNIVALVPGGPHATAFQNMRKPLTAGVFRAARKAHEAATKDSSND